MGYDTEDHQKCQSMASIDFHYGATKSHQQEEPMGS